MKILLSGMRCGKTTEAIKLSAKKFAYIVCMNMEEVDRVSRMARDMGLDIPQPITFFDLIQRRYYGEGIKGFIIDNADVLLQRLCENVPLLAITLTKENEKTKG